LQGLQGRLRVWRQLYLWAGLHVLPPGEEVVLREGGQHLRVWSRLQMWRRMLLEEQVNDWLEGHGERSISSVARNSTLMYL